MGTGLILLWQHLQPQGSLSWKAQNSLTAGSCVHRWYRRISTIYRLYLLFKSPTKISRNTNAHVKMDMMATRMKAWSDCCYRGRKVNWPYAFYGAVGGLSLKTLAPRGLAFLNRFTSPFHDRGSLHFRGKATNWRGELKKTKWCSRMVGKACEDRGTR